MQIVFLGDNLHEMSNLIWLFMQIVSPGDNLHEMCKSNFRERQEKI